MMISSGVAVLYALGVAIYGRKAIRLYVGPIAVGVGVAVITATAAILLTRTMTPLSLLCALVALVSGNVLWWLGDRDARETMRKVRPLAEAIRDAEPQREQEHDNAI